MINPEDNLSMLMDSLEFYRRRYHLLVDTISQIMFWCADTNDGPDDTEHWNSVINDLHRVAEMWRVQSIDTLEGIERRLAPIKEELGA